MDSSGFIRLITALATFVVLIITQYIQTKKIQEVHVLVNSRLTAALQEIKDLREFIRKNMVMTAAEVPPAVSPPLA